MKEEIIGGLRNALERGSSLETAIQSFVSSGYNPQEVRDAAEILTKGAMSIVSTSAITAKPSVIPLPSSVKPLPQSETFRKAESNTARTILLVFLILVLLGLLGAIAYVLLNPEAVQNYFG